MIHITDPPVLQNQFPFPRVNNISTNFLHQDSLQCQHTTLVNATGGFQVKSNFLACYFLFFLSRFLVILIKALTCGRVFLVSSP